MMSTNDLELENVLLELKELVSVLSDSDSDFRRLFLDPAFSPQERKAVINKLKDRGQVSEIMQHFLRLLIDKGRVLLLPLIEEAFQLLVDQKRGLVRATIKSAAPLDMQTINEISQALAKLCHKKVLSTPKILPELLGGIRVEVSGLIFDGTVKAKLEALRSKLIYEV